MLQYYILLLSLNLEISEWSRNWAITISSRGYAGALNFHKLVRTGQTQNNAFFTSLHRSKLVQKYFSRSEENHTKSQGSKNSLKCVKIQYLNKEIASKKATISSMLNPPKMSPCWFARRTQFASCNTTPKMTEEWYCTQLIQVTEMDFRLKSFQPDLISHLCLYLWSWTLTLRN